MHHPPSKVLAPAPRRPRRLARACIPVVALAILLGGCRARPPEPPALDPPPREPLETDPVAAPEPPRRTPTAPPPRSRARERPRRPEALPPESEAPRYVERGLASWYGPGFDGRRTANGERFDMDGVSAAHKTLPFDTLVRVHNLDNGKKIDVRINDRGPFIAGRIIDLSKGAARGIDLIGPGVASVEIEVLRWPEHLVPGGANGSRTGPREIQVASFRDRDLARDLARSLSRVPELREPVVVERATPWHRVRIREVSAARLEAVLALLRGRGFDPLVLDGRSRR